MRYNQIRTMDIANGEGIRTSLFVQGCEFYCKGCFNTDTWNFLGGKEWNKNVEDIFIKCTSLEHIDGITIIGGEPLHNNNINTVYNLIKRVKTEMSQKTIWVYSGFEFEHMLFDSERFEVLKLIDVLVDGRFVDDLKDLTLKWRGSKNQRVIDVQKSLKQNGVILHSNI